MSKNHEHRDTRRHIARTLTNIARRAETLLGKHYTIIADAVMGVGCDCPAFAEYDTCNHFQAVDVMLKEAVQGKAADRGTEQAEEARNFFDSRCQPDYSERAGGRNGRPLWTSETWQAAQEGLDSPGRRSGRSDVTDPYVYYLRGRVRCLHCGCPCTQAGFHGRINKIYY